MIHNNLMIKWNMDIAPTFRLQILERYPEKFFYAESIHFNLENLHNNRIEVMGNLNILKTEVHELIINQEKFKVILRAP